MTFPQTLLPLAVEIKPDGGAWTSISSSVYQRDNNAVSITRGRRDEQATVDPTIVNFTLNNRTGNFSPRNPSSTYYGTIGRNTQCRGYLPGAIGGLDVPAKDGRVVISPLVGGGRYASGAYNAAFNISGDIDLRADVYLYDWGSLQGGISQRLVQRWTGASDLAYILETDVVAAGPRLRFAWTTDGVAAHQQTVEATVPLPQPWFGRKAVRATMQVNNGAGGHTATFYYASTIAGPWTQLGAPVVVAGTTSIYAAGTAPIYTGPFCVGAVYGAQVYNGIAGTLVANADFTAQADGTTSFTDSQGIVWSTVGNSQITKKDSRWYTEMSSWPQKWDTTGKNVYVPMTGSGILRRLGVTPALRSSYYRSMTSLYTDGVASNNPVAYWPMEEGSNSVSFAAYSAPTNNGSLPSTMQVSSGVPNFGASTADFACSASLPTIENGVIRATVPSYTSSGATSVTFLLAVPASGFTGPLTLLRIKTGGSLTLWDLVYDTGGGLALNGYDNLGNSVVSSVNITFNLNGVPSQVQVSLTTSGGNVNWMVACQPASTLTNNGASFQFTGTATSQSVTTTNSVTINPNGAAFTGVVFGHLAVWNVGLLAYGLGGAVQAHAGETAGARIIRLCDEEGISCVVKGWSDGTSKMGPQTIDTLINLLRQCESTDHGILYEPREFFGLAYRTRHSMCAQPTGITLTYSSADLSNIVPQDDDQLTRNDVTASKPQGGSVRKYQSTGVMAITGRIGDYATSATVNCLMDGGLSDHATWLLHTGTVDEARYPTMGVELARTNFSTNSTLTNAAIALDIGDLLLVTGMTATGLPPDDIRQLVQGYTESMPTMFQRGIVWNCAPASPYDVIQWDDGVSRYSSQGASLYVAAGTGDTKLKVYTTSGARWITSAEAAGSFPFDIIIDGERITVTAINAYSTTTDAWLNPNPTFEVNTSDWSSTTGTITRDTTTFHDGIASLKFVNTSATNSQVKCDSGGVTATPVTPGRTVALSAWVRTDTTRNIQCNINWYNSSGTFVSSSAVGPTSVTLNTWTQFTTSAVVPTGIAYADMSVINSGTIATSLQLWVDNAGIATDVVQSFVVTRAVNGVSKTHAVGASVALFRPYYYGLAE